MLVLLGKIHGLVHFGLGDLVGVYATHSHSFLMNMEHNLGRFVVGLVEEVFQNMNNKLHGRVVVIQHQNPIHRRLFCFAAAFDGHTLIIIFAITTRIPGVRRRHVSWVIPSFTGCLLSFGDQHLSHYFPIIYLLYTICDIQRAAKGQNN